MPPAPTTAAASAVQTGDTSSRYPSATPAKATCPIPSPIRLISRCTRKNPTVGASTPTIAPAANASRMNSRSSMGVRGVVPDARQVGRRAVEDDSLTHQHQPADEVLDGAELVRDVEDRHAELAVQAIEQRRERLLRLDVDTRGRLVEHQEARLGRERLRDERALLLPTGEPRQRSLRERRQAHPLDRLVDRLAILGPQPPDEAQRRPAGLDELAYRHRRMQGDLRALGEVPDPPAVADADATARRALEAEHEPEQSRLATTVRAGDRH